MARVDRTALRSGSRGLRRAEVARRAVRLTAVAALLATAAAWAPSTLAAAPERLGPFVYEGSFIGFNCDGFDIRIDGHGTDRATVFFDASGDVAKFAIFARFPQDVMTNTVSGRSIVVRASFQEFIEPVPGTDQFTRTIVGHRYLVNEPGVGVTIRDVGRITYGDLEQTIVLLQAGEHDLALEAAIGTTFCDALA